MKLLSLFRSLLGAAPNARPAECAERLKSGAAVLVDVRERREWAHGVAKGAALLPLTDLTGSREEWGPFLAATAGRELLIYCHLGGRSGVAARILVREGIRAVNTGGIEGWRKAGWPMVKPEPPGEPGS